MKYLRFARLGFLLLACVIMVVSLIRARSSKNLSGGNGLVLALETSYQNDYVLPYPGMLPDHPLYLVKMIRDRIREWTAFSPESKAELYLVLANKRIGAAQVLVEGGKSELGISTAEKGYLYQSKAVYALSEMKLQGKEVGAVGNELEQAIDKHSQILVEINPKVSDQDKPKLNDLLTKMDTNYIEVVELLGR
jgi:hypothetical protein